MNKQEWARSELSSRLTGVSSKSEKKKIFKQVWKDAKKKFD